MLEVVGVECAVGQGLVRQDIVVIGDDLELVAFVGEGLLDLLEDLGVRGGAGADGDDFVIGSGSVLVISGLVAAGLSATSENVSTRARMRDVIFFIFVSPLYFHFGICVVSDVRMCSSGRHIRPRRMFTRSSAG